LLLGCTRPGASGEASTSEGSGESGTTSSTTDSDDSWSDSYCVAAGTLVSTPTGERAIEDLAIGDLVYALDPHTGERVATAINFVRSKTRRCLDFQIEGGATLRCTHDHPVYSPDHHSYANAGHWRSGELTHMLVVTDEGLERRRVAHVEQAPEDCVVFDIGVEHELHNFLANRVLVHNKSVASYDSNDWSDEDEAATDTGRTFVGDESFYACGEECDILNPNDCPEGEKCTAAGCDSDTWDSNVCREVQGNAARGDECVATDEDPLSGNDTCDFGSMCWDIAPDTLLGTCVAFCQGPNYDDLTCPAGSTCNISNNGVLPLCVPMCDPIAQDCSDGVCILHPDGDEFVCDLSAVNFDLLYGEDCTAGWCAPGLQCVPGDWVPEPACGPTNSCCTPYCDVNQPNDCPGLGQECMWLPDQDPVPGFEHIGLCISPPPMP
jgi:hypothetical protein